MSSNCYHCGTAISADLKDHEIGWCHECIRDNADELKKLKLFCFDEPKIEHCIKNKLTQAFSLQDNVEKLKAIPRKTTTTCDHCDKNLGYTHQLSTYALWCNECRVEDNSLLQKLDLRTSDGDRVNVSGSGNLRLSQVDNIAKIRSIPKKQSIFATHPRQVMKVADTKLGDTIKFIGGDNNGLIGTVIAVSGEERAIATKAKNTSSYMAPISIFTSLGRSNVNKLSDEQIKQFDTFLWFAMPHNVELIEQSSEEKKDISMKLKDVAIGQSVELSDGTIGTVAGKTNNGRTITLAWKSSDPKPYKYAYEAKTAFASLGLNPNTLQCIDDYTLAYNFSDSTEVKLSTTQFAKAKDVPLGAKVKWKDYVGVVASKHIGGDIAIGWRQDEKHSPSATTFWSATTDVIYLPNKNDYVKHLWLTQSEQVEVLESEESMLVNLKDLFIGQDIDHPTLGKMIVLGNYVSSGEKLLGRKMDFPGSTKKPGINTGDNYQYYEKFDGTGYFTKWFPGSEQVNVIGPRLLKFGLKVGDKVEIYRRAGSTGLMDAGYTPDTAAEKVVGTVVGCNGAGDPNVYVEERGSFKSPLNTFNSSIIDKSFLDNKSFVEKANKQNNFWLIRTDKAFNKITKENKMEDTTTRPALMDMLKGDATNAAYRVAANQMTKGIKSGILSVLEKQGMGSDKIKAITEMLDTEFGTSLVSILLGMGLTYVPKISEDPRAQRLAGEFRVNGMAVAGNMVMDVALQHFLPVITGALNALPQETAIRVADVPQIEAKKTDNKDALEQAVREEEEKASEKTEQTMKA